MIPRLAIFMLLLCVTAAADVLPAFDIERFLDAQRAIENFQGRDGRAGERGPYQIKLVTWQQHMPGVSFDEARNEIPARICARQHVGWLRKELRASGCDDGPVMTSLAYNVGLENLLAGRARVNAWRRAFRVRNLYDGGRR